MFCSRGAARRVNRSTTILLLRAVAGILTLVTAGLVGLRLYVMARTGIPTGPDSALHALRLLFPLSLALLFGYMALKGKFPFTDKKDRQKRPGR